MRTQDLLLRRQAETATRSPGASPPGETAWHSLAPEAALEILDARATGLSTGEARARLERLGPNVLPRARPPALWEIALRQFLSPLVYILGIAAAVSLALGEVKDAVFIVGVLVVNAIIGCIQEAKAEKATQALQQLLNIRATVRRDGQLLEVDAVALVPGDVVYLESGNRVPADLRLLSTHGLEVDESLLTGESLPVTKDPAWLGPADTPVADRLNMAHAGTMVARGRCQAVVAATGADSAIGRLAADVVAGGGGRPPLLLRMDRFTRRIGLAVLVAATVVALMGVVIDHFAMTEMFMFGVALAVSAIPEGLPVALTVALAVATTRMAQQGVIVRRLAAVEGLGSCTLIASDKTGTLTCNELTVRELRLPGGETLQVTGQGFVPDGEVLLGATTVGADAVPGLDELVRAVVLCNESDLHHSDGGWSWRGDATDVALLVLARKLGRERQRTLEACPLINELPFEPERRYAASFHRVDGRCQVMVKGAPETVLEMCEAPDDTRRCVRDTARDMADRGFRVLAVATGPGPETLESRDVPPEPGGLRLLGLVGMIDPLREGVRQAVADAHLAGVTTIMVTGDHPATALAIARDLGLAEDTAQVMTGGQLADSPPGELPALMERIRVFARVAPHQKLEIVQAAQRAGHFVAVTGDGANDAPALKAGNIGVAMGRSGTDVAREAAELVISDDHFATITAGIEQGRIAYDNIRNVIYLLVSTGAAEVVLVALAIGLGTPIPLLPVQLLWLNLVTNGIQDVALAFERGSPTVLRRAPRPPGEPVFNRLMFERTAVGALVMGVVGFVVFLSLLDAGYGEAEARNALLLLMVLFENVHLFNCRSETRSAFAIPLQDNPLLISAIVMAFSIHVAMLYLPWGNQILDTRPVAPMLWLVLCGASVSILVAMELHKLIWALRHRAGVRPR